MPRRSVEMEDIEVEDHHSRGIRPVNESSDRSDDEGGRNADRAASVIDVNDNSDEEPVSEETDEAERGTIPIQFTNIWRYVNVMQIASQNYGTHRFMPSSTPSHLLTILVTLLGVPMSSSAMRRRVTARVRPGDMFGGTFIRPIRGRLVTFSATRKYVGARTLLKRLTQRKGTPLLVLSLKGL
jgi:hypothetical protein